MPPPFDIDYLALEYDDTGSGAHERDQSDRWRVQIPTLDVTLVFTGGHPDWPHALAEAALARWPEVVSEVRARITARLRPPHANDFEVLALHVPATLPHATRGARFTVALRRRSEPGTNWRVTIAVSDHAALGRTGGPLYLRATAITKHFPIRGSAGVLAPAVSLPVQRATTTATANAVDVVTAPWVEVSPLYVWVADARRLGLSQDTVHVHVRETDDAIADAPDPERLALAGIVLSQLPALFDLARAELTALVTPYEAGARDDWYVDILHFGERRAALPKDQCTIWLKRKGDIYGLFTLTFQLVDSHPDSRGPRQLSLLSCTTTSH